MAIKEEDKKIEDIKPEDKIVEKIIADWTAFDTWKRQSPRWQNLLGFGAMGSVFEDYFSVRRVTDDTKSHTFIPYAKQNVDTFLSGLFDVAVASRPYLPMVNSAQSWEINQKVTRGIDNQLYRDDYPYKTYLIFKDILIYGCPVMKIVWNYESKKLPKMEYVILAGDQLGQQIARDEKGFAILESRPVDQPTIIPLALSDVFWSKVSTDPENLLYAGNRFWQTRGQLERVNSEYKLATGKDYYRNLDQLFDKGSKTNPYTDQSKQPQKEAFGLATTSSDLLGYELVEYCTDDTIYIVDKNNKILLRQDENHYGKIYYHFPAIDRVRGEIQGVGIIEPTRLLNWSLNALVDDGIDEANLATDKASQYDPDRVAGKDIYLRRGAKIPVKDSDDVGKALKWIEISGIMQYVVALYPLLAQEIQNTSSITALRKGQHAAGISSATEFAGIEALSASRSKMAIQMLEETYAKKIGCEFHRLNKLFSTKSKTIMFKEENQIQEMTIAPEDYQVDCDVQVDWSQRETNKQIQNASIGAMMERISKIPFWTPMHELLMRMWMDNINFPNKDELDKKLKETIELSKQMAMAQGGLTPGVGTNPPPFLEGDLLNSLNRTNSPPVERGGM